MEREESHVYGLRGGMLMGSSGIVSVALANRPNLLKLSNVRTT